VSRVVIDEVFDRDLATVQRRDTDALIDGVTYNHRRYDAHQCPQPQYVAVGNFVRVFHA